jgi:alkanesulfonate monooxygenase SsuD/methylene tetrahydromethanopterin reductase-like flavin-dependent oxidoreductase (luciferase family)
MAAAAAQRTKKLKLLIYGNLLPLHEPLRLAEELAMLDCLSNGRLISGFARGIPREYQVHNVPLKDSRARYEEAYEIVTRAWSEDIFSYSGQFWSYKDVAIWPRPVQKPGPEIWIPIVGSKESIEDAGYVSQTSNDYVRPENMKAAAGLREDYRNMTMADFERQAENMPLGTAKEVTERIISAAEAAGANQVQISLNRGALPHEMFMEQIRRFAREVLPALQAHEVVRVPLGEDIAA